MHLKRMRTRRTRCVCASVHLLPASQNPRKLTVRVLVQLLVQQRHMTQKKSKGAMGGLTVAAEAQHAKREVGCSLKKKKPG